MSLIKKLVPDFDVLNSIVHESEHANQSAAEGLSKMLGKYQGE